MNKKYIYVMVIILFIFLTGFLTRCHKEKFICNKCLDKNAHSRHIGFCRIILSDEEIKRTDNESDLYLEQINTSCSQEK